MGMSLMAQASDCIRSGQKSIMVKPPNQPVYHRAAKEKLQGAPLTGLKSEATDLAFQADR